MSRFTILPPDTCSSSAISSSSSSSAISSSSSAISSNLNSSTLIDIVLPLSSQVKLKKTMSHIGHGEKTSLMLSDFVVTQIVDVIKSATQMDRTSDHIQSMPITVANGRTIRMSAVGLGSSAKAFANSSSLSVSWELNKCNDLAFWDDAYYTMVSKSNWERFLVLKNASGLCTVHAVVMIFEPALRMFSLMLYSCRELQLASAI